MVSFATMGLILIEGRIGGAVRAQELDDDAQNYERIAVQARPASVVRGIPMSWQDPWISAVKMLQREVATRTEKELKLLRLCIELLGKRSAHTIDSHLRNMDRKLDTSNQSAAVKIDFRPGIIQ